MKIVVSGIQSTNMLTLGNYLGAIKNFIDLQDNHKMFVFIADLHSITINFEPKQLEQNRKAIAAMYFACGLNIKNNLIFYQSSIIEHSHLAYILLCHSYIGELNRMTQFKDKSSKINQANKTVNIPSGLLTYPTLMAADILLYDADIVPVGKDQMQHMELTKDLAIRFNKKYQTNIFKIPEISINKIGAKIMDLQNPEIKMSKSNPNQKGTIFLLESPTSVRKKIMSAKTDSLDKIQYDITKQPGVSNLISIYSLISKLSIKEIETKYKNKKYGDFKNDLADLVCQEITTIQQKYFQIINDKNFDNQIKENSKICKKIATKKINEIHKILGLHYE